MGRSRGGFSSKIHAITTASEKAKPLHITLTPGQTHEVTEAADLLPYAHGKACIADTSYDSAEVRETARSMGMKPVIPSHPTRAIQRRPDKRLYRIRYRIECFFHRLKRFRAVATRYEKSATNFLAVVHIACLTMWLD